MTTALTPNAANHEGLGAMASRFVETDVLPGRRHGFPACRPRPCWWIEPPVY